jgi:hypothetical protein
VDVIAQVCTILLFYHYFCGWRGCILCSYCKICGNKAYDVGWCRTECWWNVCDMSHNLCAAFCRENERDKIAVNGAWECIRKEELHTKFSWGSFKGRDELWVLVGHILSN